MRLEATRMSIPWTAADVPDLSGRTAVVTGASAGIGLEAAGVLARRGADVVVACRDGGRGAEAVDRIRGEGASGRVLLVRLDLASLTSVRSAADEIRDACPRLDLLVNNAGVMQIPYELTEDGFERTMAVNHLGHFALTGHLLDRLLATAGSRVVTVSSIAHLRGVIDVDDVGGKRQTSPSATYAASKLANLLFTAELARRLAAAGSATIALAAHPGIVPTGLWRTSSRLERVLISPRLRVLNRRLVQPAAQGALPILRAAVDPAARPGDLFGPGSWHAYTGPPVIVEPGAAARDEAVQRRLWVESERLTGVVYALVPTLA
jgi:NAD(P)-dependent dehydrogenase (short-subunit alcohol dehydrogenase family)